MYVRYPDRAVLTMVEVAHHGVLHGRSEATSTRSMLQIFATQIWWSVAKSSSNPGSYLDANQSSLPGERNHGSCAVGCGFLCGCDEHSFGEHRDRRVPLSPPRPTLRDAEPGAIGHPAAPGLRHRALCQGNLGFELSARLFAIRNHLLRRTGR